MEIQVHRKSNTPGHWVWLAACFSWALFACCWGLLLWLPSLTSSQVSKDFCWCYSGLFFPLCQVIYMWNVSQTLSFSTVSTTVYLLCVFASCSRWFCYWVVLLYISSGCAAAIESEFLLWLCYFFFPIVPLISFLCSVVVYLTEG